MNTLIDITSIHRIGLILDSKKNEQVRAIDIVALLHFIELILFSENIYYVKFDKEVIEFETDKILEKLVSYDCMPLNRNRLPLIQPLLPNHEEYFEFCRNAGTEGANIILDLSRSNFFINLPTMLDEASHPKFARVDDIYSILKLNPISSNEIEDYVLNKIKNDKVDGTMEAMVISNPNLKTQLKRIYNHERSRKFDLFIRNLLRIKINERIAKSNNCIYSPAPQRARFDELISSSVLNEINRSIWEIRDNIEAKRRFDGLIEQIRQSEKMPLPAIAMALLSKVNWHEPIDLLQLAAQYRQESLEVKEVRDYLTRLENTNVNGDYLTRQKIFKEIKNIKDHLQRKFKDPYPKSIQRTGLKVMLNFFKTQFDKGISEDELDRIEDQYSLSIKKNTTTMNFLTLITNNLLSENELGAWLFKSFDRKIIN